MEASLYYGMMISHLAWDSCRAEGKELLINRDDPSNPLVLEKGQMSFIYIKVSDPPDPP